MLYCGEAWAVVKQHISHLAVFQIECLQRKSVPLHIVNGICCALAKGAGRCHGTCTHQMIHWSALPSKFGLHQGSQQVVIECGQFTTMHNGIPDTVARLKANIRRYHNPSSYTAHDPV